jgi:hypothetical protein
MQKEAYRPTLGSTPAIIEKAMASGIKAKATTVPASTSPRILLNHVSPSERVIAIEVTTSNYLLIYFISPACYSPQLVDKPSGQPITHGGFMLIKRGMKGLKMAL